MSEQELNILIHKQLTGQTDAGEAELFQKWLAEKETNAAYFQKMAAIWSAAGDMDFNMDAATEAEWQKLRTQLPAALPEKKAEAKIVRFGTAWRLAAAAVVLLGVSLWWLLGRQDSGLPASQTFAAANGKTEQFTLADGTTIALNAGSTLEAEKGFGGKDRRVKLSGEAFFQVAADKNKPFIVDALGATVRVVGTAFNVQAYPESRMITTSVAEGKVEFLSEKGSKTLLTPGVEGYLEKAAGSITTRQVDIAKIAAWQRGVLLLNNIPLAEALELIKRHYAVGLKIEGDISGKKVFSAFDNEPLEEVLNVLELTYDLDIETKNDTIIIRNK